MVKLIIGFIILAAGALYLLSKGGSNLDMGGEKHGVETSHPAPAAVAPSAEAPASAAK